MKCQTVPTFVHHSKFWKLSSQNCFLFIDLWLRFSLLLPKIFNIAREQITVPTSPVRYIMVQRLEISVPSGVVLVTSKSRLERFACSGVSGASGSALNFA